MRIWGGLSNAVLINFEGAEHTSNPCTVCQTSLNEFGDTESELFNFVGDWLEARY